jgi:hypothetical protein
MTVAYNRLVGINKITDKVGSRNLVISFNYIKDSIEKVSYNIEDNKFNLVIEPKPNFPPLDPNKVSYSYTGANADLVFIVGAAKLEDLDNFYYEEKKVFEDKLTINIDYKSNNTKFGKINLYDNQASSCSEIVSLMIRDLAMPVDADIASNLLSGIKANTSNFQAFNVSASAFEIAAWCLQNGARKDYFTPIGFPSQPLNNQNIPFTPPPFTQGNIQSDINNHTPPADWLKPKIYKSKSNN